MNDPSTSPPSAPSRRLALGAAIVLVVLCGASLARVEARSRRACGPACVDSLRESLRELRSETDILRAEIGRLWLELGGRDAAPSSDELPPRR